MSNKSRLQANNTNLQALIDKANALPNAGGGGGSGSSGSVETCNLAITTSSSAGAFSLEVYFATPDPDNGIAPWSGSVSFSRLIKEHSFENVALGNYIILVPAASTYRLASASTQMDVLYLSADLVVIWAPSQRVLEDYSIELVLEIANAS